MAKRYYFTNENGDNIGNDHIGNIRGAKTVAKRLANELNCEVCINDCETEDMVDFVYPDRTETVESVEVAEETTVSETATVETEIVEKYILRLTADDGFVLCIKVFVGTSKEADEESERVMAETGYDVSYVRYTDSRWNYMSKKYYCKATSESALTVISPNTMLIKQETESDPTTDTETDKAIAEYQTICTVGDVNGATKSLALAKWDRRNSGQAPPKTS